MFKATTMTDREAVNVLQHLANRVWLAPHEHEAMNKAIANLQKGSANNADSSNSRQV